MAEEKLTPELRETLSYLKAKPCVYISTREVAEALKISYSAAYYRLRRLVDLGLIVEHISWVVRPRIRRRWFHYIPPPLYTLKIEVNDPKMGTTEPPPGTYTYPKDTSVTAQAMPNPGYRFNHWTLDGETRTENPITVVMDKDHTLKAFFTAPFYKSHCVVSFAYVGENYFEVHEIIPHLKEELPVRFAQNIAYDVLVNYGLPDNFLKILSREVSMGAVQTKPVTEFPDETHATIFDVHTVPKATRQSFKLKWRYKPAWIEVKITGEKVEHPAEVEYVGIEPVPKIEEEQLKEEWRKEK